MIVVSDATCLNHLIRSGAVEVLPQLFGSVVIPTAVFNELQSVNTPEIVKRFIAGDPAWLGVRQPSLKADLQMENLDPGECEAILLAEEIGADFLLIDEKRGRRVAVKRNLPVTGTMAVLLRAALAGLIEYRLAVQRLKSSGFYLSYSLEQQFEALYETMSR